MKSPAFVTVGDKNVDILDQASAERDLGRELCFQESQATELRNRIAAAWGAFHKFSPLLCCREVPLAQRLPMLARGVHPAVFWCAGSWDLRAKPTDQIERASTQDASQNASVQGAAW